MARIIFVATVLALAVTGSHGLLGFGNRCPDEARNIGNDRGTCAIVFDEDNCRGTQERLGHGYTKFTRKLRNDAESVIVKPGCIFIGYSNYRSSPNDYFEGDNVVLDASGRHDPLIVDNLDNDQVDEDMESASCYCPRPGAINSRDWVSKISDSNQLQGSAFTRMRGGTNIARCNEQAYAIFNREDGPRVAAMLYDENACKGRMKEIGVGSTSLSSVISENLDDDVESVLVRPGCTLIGYDHGPYNILGKGDSVTIDASRNAKEPIASNIRGSLDEDISYVEVRCR